LIVIKGVELFVKNAPKDLHVLRMFVTGKVGDDFAFTFTRSTQLGFTGIARKSRRQLAERGYGIEHSQHVAAEHFLEHARRDASPR